jgi:hypothetical protein
MAGGGARAFIIATGSATEAVVGRGRGGDQSLRAR